MVAEVYMWGSRIGVVMQEDVTDIPKFSYTDEFLQSGIEVSPLMMPLARRMYSFPALRKESFHGLPGLLADSLPDRYGTKLIERYLIEQGKTLEQFTAVERLCYVGKRGMGALEYIPAKGYSDIADSTIQLDALVKLASDILTEKESVHIRENDCVMRQIIKIGTSAGGARAKAIVAWNEETKDIRSGQIEAGLGYDYWLIKFDGVRNNKDHGDKEDGPGYTNIEYAYYLMAKAAGIEMSECRLFEDGGYQHFMTKRFDRQSPNGKKIHMQTLGALAHFDYNLPGAYAYEQVGDIIYRLGMGQREIEQFYRRMVFNVLAKNQDDHVKNTSFLMNMKGDWALSPAYDITYAYDPTNYWLSKHQMSINGKVENITKQDLLDCGKRMNISKMRSTRIIEDVGEKIEKWLSYAEQAKVKEQTAEMIQKNLK